MKSFTQKLREATQNVSSKWKFKSSALNTAISIGAFIVAAVHPTLPPGNTLVMLALLLLGAVKRRTPVKTEALDAPSLNKKLDDIQRVLNAFGIERMKGK